MLKRLRFSDFRGYAGEHEIALTPITLLYGHNSAGKTSILKLIQLLAESDQSVTNGCLRIDGKSFPALEGRRLQSAYSSKNFISVSLTFESDPSTEVTHCYDILTDQSYPRVYRLMIGSRDGLFVLTDVDGTGSYTVTLRDQPQENVQLSFRGLHPSLKIARPNSEKLEAAIASLRQDLQKLTRSVVRLTADRVPFPEQFTYAETQLGDWGSGVPSALIQDESGQLLADLNAWFKKSQGVELKLQDFATPNGKRYSLYLENPRTSQRILIAETGQGVRQVLPVLVACNLVRDPAFKDGLLLMIEHPELHLHTSLHHHVMSKVIESFGKRNEQAAHCVILETHSESILLEAQIAILEKRLDPAAVSVVWVTEADSGATTLRQTELDATGLPTDPAFPIEAFMAQAQLAQKAITLRHSNAG